MKDDEQHKSARKQSTINDKKRQLSSMEQAICERAFVIFQGDIEKIAKALNAPMESINKVVRARRMELQPPKYVSAVEPIKKKKGKSEYQSMKNSTIPNGSITFKTAKYIPPLFRAITASPAERTRAAASRTSSFATRLAGGGRRVATSFVGVHAEPGSVGRSVVRVGQVCTYDES